MNLTRYSRHFLTFMCAAIVAQTFLSPSSLYGMYNRDRFHHRHTDDREYNYDNGRERRFNLQRPFLERNSKAITLLLVGLVAGALGWKLVILGTEHYKSKKLETLHQEFDEFLASFKKIYENFLTTYNKTAKSSPSEQYKAAVEAMQKLNPKDSSLKTLIAMLKTRIKSIETFKQKVEELQLEDSTESQELLEQITTWQEECKKMLSFLVPLRTYQDTIALLTTFEKKYTRPISMIANLHESTHLRKMLTDTAPITLAFDFAQQVETDLAQIKQSLQQLREIKPDAFYEPLQKKLEYYQEQLNTIQRIIKKSYEYNLEERYLREIKKLKEALSRHESQLSGLESNTHIILQRPSDTHGTGYTR